ncbi:MAG: hypothetical protein RIS64_2869 [Bacteroidota bacterium]|jgi:hypothetical protein
MQVKYGYFISIALAITIISCAQESKYAPHQTSNVSDMASAASAAPPAPESTSNQKQKLASKTAANEEDKSTPSSEKIEVVERKIIKIGEIRFETKDLNQTKSIIAKSVADLKGYISEESQNNSDYRKENKLVVRIPAGQFDSLLTVLGTYAGHFDSKSVHTQDVTEEFIDVSARLKTQRDLETQYAQVLKQAKNVKEIMEVQGYLAEVREKIESAEGRLRYLSNQVGFSTLTIHFYKTMGSAGHSRGFFWRLTHEFGNGWQGFLNLIVGLVSVWPFWLMVFSGVWFYRRWKKGGGNIRFWKK